MKNYVYEKDYSHVFEIEDIPVPEYSCSPDLLQRVFKRYDEAKKLPRKVIPKNKATFERLVPKLDKYAETYGGTIKAVVDYEEKSAGIELAMPFFECTYPEEIELFTDMVKNCESIFFDRADNDHVRMRVYIQYFEELKFPER